MSLYLDASAIVPILVDQPSSAAVDERLRDGDEPLVVSDFAGAEVASALSRLVRIKAITADEAAGLLREFDSWRAISAVGVDIQPADFRLADLMVRRFDLGLRATDALHAAVCLRSGYHLATLDRRLADAAEALGVAVARLG